MDRTSDRRALGPQLRVARERAGLTVTSASEAARIDATVLADLEADRRRPTPADLERLSSALDVDLTGLLPPRRPVEFHPSTGNLVIDGVRQRRVGTGSVGDVQEAYLSLLYAVRVRARRHGWGSIMAASSGTSPGRVRTDVLRLWSADEPAT